MVIGASEFFGEGVGGGDRCSKQEWGNNSGTKRGKDGTKWFVVVVGGIN